MKVLSSQDNTPLDIMLLRDDNRIVFGLWYRACSGSSSLHAKGARRCRQQALSRPQTPELSRARRRDLISP
jgi:hypothetical protein